MAANTAYQKLANGERTSADRQFASTFSTTLILIGVIAAVSTLLAIAGAFVMVAGINRGIRDVLSRLRSLKDNCVA